MTRKRQKRGITPWKRSVLRLCFLLLLIAAGLHVFRLWKASRFQDQREASRWGTEFRSAQVSAFLPARSALKEEQILELEFKINTALTQDSIKLTAEGPDARLWQDCYSGMGNLTIRAGGKTVDVDAIGTGGAFFTFHPLMISAGSYYSSDSLMKDEILLDEETAWKLFGAFDVAGRTVMVEDMHLTISGVYRNERDKLYEKAGLPQNAVFVQYKTLLQFGGEDAGTGTGEAIGASRVRTTSYVAAATDAGASRVRTAPSTATAASDDSLEIELDDAQDSGSADGSGTAGADGTGGANGTGSDSGTGSGTDENAGSPNGSSNENTQNMENVGTGNTAYKDTGKITIYEIVMPDPVEGYAASVVETALGEESGAVVVDNTNRFTERSLLGDLRDFALLGMRTQPVRYPFWENIAMGWETIFAALLLAEFLLVILTVILLLLLVVHWYRHRGWTVASRLRGVGDSIYEKQSRRRYPEYYEDRQEEYIEEQAQESRPAMSSGSGDPGEGSQKAGLLEDKGAIPFERIREDRKAVKVENLESDRPEHNRTEQD